MTNYFIRLDDACPTMNWDNWNRIFAILNKYNVKPIVAVVPNNEDGKLKIDTHNNQFWFEVKKWETNGYQIAMHGFNHVYTSKKRGIVPFNNRSEFAGLSKEEQTQKIKKSWTIFRKNNILPKIWVAPAHSFDKNTLFSLKTETGITVISDGVSMKPYVKQDFFWLPQQLWKPENKTDGIWTICYHPNTMKEENFEFLDSFINNNKEKFNVELSKVITMYGKRKKSIPDYLFMFVFFIVFFTKKIYSKL